MLAINATKHNCSHASRFSCRPAALRCGRSVVQLRPARAEEEEPKSRNNVPEKVSQTVDAMKKRGVDEKIARKVLQSWQKEGLTDARGLRNKLLGQGFSLVGLAAFQLLTDALAAYCSTSTATVFQNADFAGAGLLSLLFQFIFYYFAIGAALDVFRLGAVLGGAASLGAKADTLYSAIEELAEAQSGLALVDKAQAAVNTTKVVLALNSVRRVLKEEMGVELSKGTLENLSSYLVLTHAEKTYGFKVEDVPGLSQDDAVVAAQFFSKFDKNDDYRLEMSEFKQLCDAADFGLTEEEVKAAIGIIDTRGSGYVEFDEFVKWWNGMHGALPKSDGAVASV